MMALVTGASGATLAAA